MGSTALSTLCPIKGHANDMTFGKKPPFCVSSLFAAYRSCVPRSIQEVLAQIELAQNKRSLGFEDVKQVCNRILVAWPVCDTPHKMDLEKGAALASVAAIPG